jgi:hypothetical protein
LEVFVACCPFLGTVGLVLYFVFTVLKLGDHFDTSWSWYEVFAPLWAAIFIWGVFLAWIWFVVITEKRRFTKKIPGWTGGGLWMLLCLFNLLIFTILIPVKLEGGDNTISSWSLVCIPFWATMLVLLQFNRDWPDPSTRAFHISIPSPEQVDLSHSLLRFFDILPLNAIVAFSIFSILEVLYLEDILNISQLIIFAPFWYLGAIIFLLSLSNTQYHLDSFSLNLIALLVSIPFIAFAILLALKLDGILNVDYAVIFTPIWLLCVVGVCVSCSATMIICR